LWIVDDASTDNSAEVIEQFLEKKRRQGCRQAIHFLQNTENQGNCKSFNLAYRQTKGAYILDLAGDDVLLPTRLEMQVALFENLPTEYGVLFSNAKHINEAGEELSTHHAPDEQVPTGDVYEALFRRYFICTPTMLIRRQVLDDLGGYDEDLSYEDFDFWVRSARKYLYHYHPDITTLKRKVQGSLSAQFYQTKRNTHLRSTLVILKKALALNQKPSENEALQICIAYHYRQAFFMQDFKLAQEYDALWRSVPDARFPFWARVVRVFNALGLPVFWLYRLYLKR
jgi:glycosyltransferase involved in cell wall biosynthesis